MSDAAKRALDALIEIVEDRTRTRTSGFVPLGRSLPGP